LLPVTWRRAPVTSCQRRGVVESAVKAGTAGPKGFI
jgi:hypothetical protein